MVFPRINNGLRVTLVYYDIKHISRTVNVLSGRMQQAKLLDEKGKELPSWDEIVFLLHAQLEDEIQQIINLNYPHVRNIVFENLREFIETPQIKAVQKEHITKLLLDFNASEEERVSTKHPTGFSLGADPAFLPDYFIIVEKALNNLKRIINKYLRLNDTGKLPVYQPESYLPQNVPPVIEDDSSKKLSLNMTGQQLAFLFQLLDDSKALKYDDKKDMQKFLFENVEVKTKLTGFKYFQNKFTDIDKAAKKYIADLLAQMQKDFRKY